MCCGFLGAAVRVRGCAAADHGGCWGLCSAAGVRTVQGPRAAEPADPAAAQRDAQQAAGRVALRR